MADDIFFTVGELSRLVQRASKMSSRTDIETRILPRVIWTQTDVTVSGFDGTIWSDQLLMLSQNKHINSWRIDLHERGVSGCLAPLLSLCRRGDPGLYGERSSWWRVPNTDYWWLKDLIGLTCYVTDMKVFDDIAEWNDGYVIDPDIALEKDFTAALVKACRLEINFQAPQSGS